MRKGAGGPPPKDNRHCRGSRPAASLIVRLRVGRAGVLRTCPFLLELVARWGHVDLPCRTSRHRTARSGHGRRRVDPRHVTKLEYIDRGAGSAPLVGFATRFGRETVRRSLIPGDPDDRQGRQDAWPRPDTSTRPAPTADNSAKVASLRGPDGACERHNGRMQMSPSATMASATRWKPAMLAPVTRLPGAPYSSAVV